MKIRRVHEPDFTAVWGVLEPVLRTGDTYTLPPDVSREAALAYWCGAPHETFLAEAEVTLGTYYLRPNQQGHGDHVCNCGFMTAPQARGRGVARAMLDHALERARARGFAAMQFNFVVASNVRAIAIWRAYGFDIVGRVPQAFRHPKLGLVDALILHRFL